ncbi:MAG: UbiA family prenyltransferase, partial [Thermoplasmata archaeon]
MEQTSENKMQPASIEDIPVKNGKGKGKESHPHLSPKKDDMPADETGHFLKKIKGLIQLVRPFTLLAPVIGGLAGSLMGWIHTHGTIDGIHWQTVIDASICLAVVNAASNSLNGVYDYDIDKINKPNRPLPSGMVTKDEALTISIIFYLLALFRAVLTNAQFGAIMFLIILITVFYSVPPLRLKKRLWLSNL